MIVKELIEKMELEIVAEGDLERKIKGGYSCDLLSNVMARASDGDVWMTVQGHQNIVAIASLTNVAAILVVEDFKIDDNTINKAKAEGINILRSSATAYQLSGQLFKLGV